MDEDFCLPGSGAAAGRVSAVGTDGMVMAEGRILVGVNAASASENLVGLGARSWSEED